MIHSSTARPTIPCSPTLETKPVCDIMDLHYGLLHQQQFCLPVKVIVHARLQRYHGAPEEVAGVPLLPFRTPA